MTTSANALSITEQTVRELSRRLNEPEWLLSRRVDAYRAFASMAMPNPLAEEWRRTDISALDLEATLAAPRDAAATWSIGDEAPGVYARGHGLPDAFFFGEVSQALPKHEALLREHLHSLVLSTEWRLSALQATLWQQGALVYVPRGVEVEVPLHYLVSGAAGPVFPHLLIVAEENSSVTVIQETESPSGQAQSLAVGAVEIVARPDARVRFLEVQRWGDNVYNFSTIRARLDRGSRLTAGLVGLGSRLTKTKLEAIMDGDGASAELLGLSFGDGHQHFDYGTLQDHIAPRTASDLLFKAALEDHSSEVWTGTVHIQKGASLSEANQTSRNLLLSDHAKAAPIPVLEIEAYDILRCSHGASAGPLDEEQRFYLESRGIPKAEAERLLVEAFFQPVLDRMPAEAIRPRLEAALAAKIEAGY